MEGDNTLGADEILAKQVYAALEVEPRINMHQYPLELEARDGKLMLRGEVAGLAAKRLAVRLSEDIAGKDRIIDQLCIVPSERKGDGEILDGFSQFLLRQIDLKNCTLRRRARGQVHTLHEALGDDYDRCGDIEFSVEDGVVSLEGRVISLSHKRMAEVLAWWVPGCRNVLNGLAVMPAEEDSDDEISDAVHLALEMDPLIHTADQIGVVTSLGAVTLEGAVNRKEEREMAEFDTWCVAGTNDVINHLQVAA